MIRPATPSDAPDIAQLIILAMGPLAATFVNSDEPADALAVFTHFARLEGNQYSYKNTLVFEENSQICGMICAYNGGELDHLREPFLQYIRKNNGFTGTPENETQAGEYYIDCLSVYPAHQGKGIGKQLIKAMIDKADAESLPPLGLLVSKTNPLAEKLYASLGFEVVGEKELLGTFNRHMQYKG